MVEPGILSWSSSTRIIENVTIVFADKPLEIGVKAFEKVNEDQGGTLTIIHLCSPRGCAADSNESTQPACYRQVNAEEKQNFFFGVEAAFDGVSVDHVNQSCRFNPPAAPPPLPLAPPSLPLVPPLSPGQAGGGGKPGSDESPEDVDGGGGVLSFTGFTGVEASVVLGVGMLLTAVVLLLLIALLRRLWSRSRPKPSGVSDEMRISLKRLAAKPSRSEDRISLRYRDGGEVASPISPLDLPSTHRSGAPEAAENSNRWRARSRGESGCGAVVEGSTPGATPGGATPGGAVVGWTPTVDADSEVEWWFYFGLQVLGYKCCAGVVPQFTTLAPGTKAGLQAWAAPRTLAAAAERRRTLGRSGHSHTAHSAAVSLSRRRPLCTQCAPSDAQAGQPAARPCARRGALTAVRRGCRP